MMAKGHYNRNLASRSSKFQQIFRLFRSNAMRGLATPFEAGYNLTLFSQKEKENAHLYVSV
jgi:hypothetical protein